VMTGLLILIFMGFTLVGCSYAAGGNVGKNKPPAKGAKKEMKTYHIGRFAIDVPIEFKLAHQRHEFRLVKIEEIPVPTGQAPGKYAEQRWKERLAEIAKLKKPKGVNEIIIRQQTKNLGHDSRWVLYYGNRMANDEGYFDILVDYGQHLTLFKINGLLSEQKAMFSWVMEVVGAYRPITASRVPNAFCTKLGAIDLPYMEQENSFARFNGPMEMVLTVEMIETHNDLNKKSLTKRTADAIAAGFTRGLNIKRITAGERVVAGLGGDEDILQGNDGPQKHLRFDWEYLGKAESGEFPAIQINVETVPDHREEKTQIWHEILDSFRSTQKSAR